MKCFKSIGSFLLFIGLLSCANTSNELESNTSEKAEVEDISDEACKFEDGIHSATVDYYNPETDYSQTYTLDVEVNDCEVIQINFPKGGWLDSDHINPAEIDIDGICNIEGEDGKTYEIQIDN